MPVSIQADFDRIAQLPERYSWSANDYYQPYLLKHLPARLESALEIGCGTGAFARILAGRTTQVTALDLSPEMIRLARVRSSAHPNISFQVADISEHSLPSGHYDCIASIATLHHLPLASILLKMCEALRPGGTILVLDLVKTQGIPDLLASLAAAPLNFALRTINTHSFSIPAGVRAAWDHHGSTDVYPTIDEVRNICASILPGARIKKHLMWRYSMIWRKPLQ